MRSNSLSTPQARSGPLEIAVLGSFRFWVSGRDALPDLPGGSQRLLAFLALGVRVVVRGAAAARLWPEASEEHAHASLRSAISRLTSIAQEAVVISYHSVRLAEHVSVDIRAARAVAQRLVDRTYTDADITSTTISLLSADLLPDWYDDWAVVEAEDWRQLRLHALDSLTDAFIAGGRYSDAIGAALAAVKAEPLRETSHASLIRAHLSEGNRAEAQRAFIRYRKMLGGELGLEPTPRISALVQDL